MLNQKLNDLKKMLMAEASLVEKMLGISMNAIMGGYECNLMEVTQFENRVNQLELEIEGFCTQLIALYQPEAKDLRAILMSYKINNDLERLGDQAVNITESANTICGNPIVQELPELDTMRQNTLAMLTQSISAFTDLDVELARKVCRDDSVVDDLNRSIITRLIAMMKDNPQQIEVYLHLMRIARNLERVADLSTNVAENTVFLAQGKVIKHHVDEQEG